MSLGMESFGLEHRLSCPPEVVFAELADPAPSERIVPLAGKGTHVRDGRGHRHGVGSVRRIQPGCEPRRRRASTTVKGVPFDHHRGVYRTEPDGAGTRFTFHLELSSRLPGLAWLIRRPLEAINRRGFDNLARQLEARASDR
jgi:hypothetical protein